MSENWPLFKPMGVRKNIIRIRFAGLIAVVAYGVQAAPDNALAESQVTSPLPDPADSVTAQKSLERLIAEQNSTDIHWRACGVVVTRGGGISWHV